MGQTDPPPAGRPAASLAGPEIVLLWATGVVWMNLVHLGLGGGGFYLWFYGPEGLPGAFAEGSAGRQLALYRQGLWATAVATPLATATVLLALRLMNVSLATAGVTVRHFGRNLVMGLLAAAVILPGTQALNYLANEAMRAAGSAAQDHPLTRLGQLPLSLIEWALLVFGAVAAAPVWEELIFRGLVQPWVLARPHRGGAAALVVALVLALATTLLDPRGRLDLAPFRSSAGDALLRFAPVWTLAFLAVVFVLLDRRSAVWGGLFASAVLFGWVHVSVWPSPVPLVWLAVGLGWLVWRGQSLVGAVVLHALTNAWACTILLAGK